MRAARDGAIYLILFAVIAAFGYGCTATLRNHGVESCEARGGTPVVSSWFSEDAWDVKCIEKSSEGGR